MDRQSNKAANLLLSLGVKKGDVVAMLMTNNHRFVWTTLGLSFFILSWWHLGKCWSHHDVFVIYHITGISSHYPSSAQSKIFRQLLVVINPFKACYIPEFHKPQTLAVMGFGVMPYWPCHKCMNVIGESTLIMYNLNITTWKCFPFTALYKLGAPAAFLNHNLRSKSLLHCFTVSDAKVLIVDDSKYHLSTIICSTCTLPFSRE